MIGSSAEIQKLVFETLTGNASIMATANGVYDRVPADPFGTKTSYVSFGPEDSHEDDSECITGVSTTIQIDVWSRKPGSVECKMLTNLVRKALHRKPLSLSENALVDVWVKMVRIMRDPDGVTSHGVVQVTFTVEEPG